MTPDDFMGISALVAGLITLAAAVRLHFRMRKTPSLLFLLSIVAMGVLTPVAVFVQLYALHYPHLEIANWLVVFSEIIVPALLPVIASICLFLVSGSVEKYSGVSSQSVSDGEASR